MTRQAVPGAVPLSPVVRVTAVPDAFSAAGSRQGQRGTLRGKQRERQSKHLMRCSGCQFHLKTGHKNISLPLYKVINEIYNISIMPANASEVNFSIRDTGVVCLTS